MEDTVSLMTELGILIHEEKSVLIPTKTITFLGNKIDSEEMTVSLPEAKKNLIVQECRVLHGKASSTIRQVARILGLMVSSYLLCSLALYSIEVLRKRKLWP